MKISARSRIAFGLSCLLVSALSVAMMLGIVPERRSAVLSGRKDFCEIVAMTSSDYISRGELPRLEFYLKAAVKRNEDILSAGIRRSDGTLVATVGDHAGLWVPQTSARSTESQVHVPIRSGQQKWGNVEFCYRPLTKPGLAGYLQNTWLRLTAFVTAVCYLLYVLYLKKMLAHLDPSKTVPRRVRSALDSLAEGLLVIDKDGRIVLANQSFAQWVDRSPEKLLGVQAAKLNWAGDQEGNPVEEYPWMTALRLESPQAGVMLGLERKNEPLRVLMANASPVLGHDGKYRGVLVSFDDVTQLEKTKDDLRVAKQEADQANQAKSEFLARMSHEIRTPMNAILGYTDVLRFGFDESVENRQEYLDTIHGSGEHLLALLNDILDLSRVESGQLELELERCSPHKLIHQVVGLLQSKAIEKGISLDVRFDGSLPETILTDSLRLRQTIVNLVGNAIKFTEHGGVTIAARLVENSAGSEAAAPQHSMLAIDVTDTGIGIPQDSQATIFEPFAQADSSVTRRFGGTGLGLAISRQLAEGMGGGVSLSSEEGKGSTFTVTIDVGSLEGIKLVDGDCAVASDAGQRADVEQLTRLPDARILVADDGEANRKLLELVLRRAGAHVVSVENGKLAVDETLRSDFDIILMDMQMPVMDGYEAANVLREAGYELPIIALTAHAMRGDEEKCRAAGCSGFLTKPIKIEKLLATLSDILGKGSTGMTAADFQSHYLSDEENVGLSPESHGDLELQGASNTANDIFAPTVGELATADDALMQCSLPLDDFDFLEIAVEFAARLHDQLEAMRKACEDRNAGELAQLAHWLKGSGGTAGFDSLTRPAFELELAAKSGDLDECGAIIGVLEAMAAAIDLPPLPETA